MGEGYWPGVRRACPQLFSPAGQRPQLGRERNLIGSHWGSALSQEAQHMAERKQSTPATQSSKTHY